MRTFRVMFLTFIALGCISFILVSLSVFLPVSIHNRAELAQVKLGAPIKFIVQDQSMWPVGYPDGPSFPIHQALLSPWESPLQIIWWRFFLSVGVVFFTLVCVYILIQALWRKVARNTLTFKA